MRKTSLFARFATVAMMSASLAACGGGDDAPAPPVAGTPTPAPPTGPDPVVPAPAVAVTGQFHLEGPAATSAQGLATLNALGQQGYAFVSSIASYTGNPLPVIGDLYVKDSAHAASKLVYQSLAPGANASAAVTQLNQQGANGFMYKGDVAYGTGTTDIRSLFVKDSTRSTTFTYEVQAGGSPVAKSALLAQLNAQGARGFRFVSAVAFNGGNDIQNLYVKTSAPAATYTYSFVDVASPFGTANGAALKQQLNDKGATGSIFRGAFVVDNFTTGVLIFEKASTQTTAITYELIPVDKNATLAEVVARANVRAAAGEFLFGDLVTDDGAFHTVYVKGGELRHPLSGAVFP